MKQPTSRSPLTVQRPPAPPRCIARFYGHLDRDGERLRAILVVDRSRYDGAAVKKATAKRGISPKLYARRQAELAAIAKAA